MTYKEFAVCTGEKHCVALNSGIDALNSVSLCACFIGYNEKGQAMSLINYSDLATERKYLVYNKKISMRLGST